MNSLREKLLARVPTVHAGTKVKPKKEQPAKPKKPKELTESVDHFKKSDNSWLVANVREDEESEAVRVDIREFVQTERYTGFTKKGINIDTENFMDLFRMMEKIKDELEEQGLLQE